MSSPKYDYMTYWQDSFTSQPKGQYLDVLISKMREYNFKTVLEIGSGTGQVSEEIRKSFQCNLTGIDIIQENQYLDRFIRADLADYDTDEKYDILVARYVLMHIKPDHIERLLSRMCKWAKNIIIIDYDPQDEIPLAPHNFRHDYGIISHKVRLSAYNSMWFT